MAHDALLENTSTQLAFLDRQFNFVFVNSAYASGSGYTAVELIGRNHFDLFPSAENRAIFERVRDTGEPAEFDAKLFVFPGQPERGETYWNWSLVPVRSADGEVSGLALTLSEVTDQVLANRATRESEARYRNLFTGMREGFAVHEIICDESGTPIDYRFLDVNPAFGELTGLDPQAIVGKTVREVLPGTEEHWIQAYGRVALTGEAIHMENYAQDLGRWYEVTAYCPAIGQFATVFVDVTQRKQMEASLRMANTVLEQRAQERTDQLISAIQTLRRQAALIDLAHDAIFVRGLDSTIRFWNDGAAEMYGWSRDQAIGRTSHDLLKTTFPEPLEHLLAGLYVSGHWEGELVQTRHDGVRLTVASRWSLERDERGAPQAILEINNDITERKQAEESLRSSREQLQDYSRGVVAALENERRSIARELHDESGQVLTSLKVGLALLQKDRECPASFVDQLEQLKQTTDAVMDGLRRLAMDLRPGALDRAGLVPAVQQYLGSFARQTGLHVDFVPLGLGDNRLPAELEINFYRMVQEALTNVARHARARNVGVVLERRDDRLLLIVEDDGAGFDLSRALQKGRLGLVGMRERAQMMGGDLTIETSPGQGTAVYVEVPYLEQPVPAESAQL
jgi:PAS domain S-box-containing protein